MLKWVPESAWKPVMFSVNAGLFDMLLSAFDPNYTRRHSAGRKASHKGRLEALAILGRRNFYRN